MPDVKPSPTILIGIGAQKAGTSWLFEYLQSHPQCYLRAVKELHYFNQWQRNGLGGVRRASIAKRQELIAKNGQVRSFLSRTVADLAEFIELISEQERLSLSGHGAYLTYLRSGCADQKIIGEVTPAYSMCSSEEFAEMLGLGTDVRFIYLLRDPVERVWSASRMAAKTQNPTGIAMEVFAAAHFDQFLIGGNLPVMGRTDYQKTLRVVAETIPSDRLLVLFYEELFRSETARRITRFLEIDEMPARTQKIVHGGLKADLGHDRLCRARAMLDDQYQAVEKYMGRLPESWHKYPKEAA